jgi:hypothetical protein
MTGRFRLRLSALIVLFGMAGCTNLPGLASAPSPDIEGTVQARLALLTTQTAVVQAQESIAGRERALAATQTSLAATLTPAAARSASATPSATPTIAPLTATPSASLTPAAPPTLVEPRDKSSFPAKEAVTLKWSWTRALAADEYFEIQLTGFRSPIPQDWMCTRESAFTIPTAPLELGYYAWAIVVRRGVIDNAGCHAQGEVTLPSVTWGFDWRGAPDVKPAQPTKKPYP